jgi:hypothetical protein
MNLFDFGALSPACNALPISPECHPFATQPIARSTVASRGNEWHDLDRASQPRDF